MKLGMAIEELHRSEDHLARALLAMSDRHKADHEVFHVARVIAAWSQDHVVQLARIGHDHGLDLSEEPADDPGLLAGVRQWGAELIGRRPEPGVLLLADLRHIYREASGTSLDWELLAQGAQAARDRGLLELSERCHPQTLRQARWANAKLKEASPQVLAS